MWIEIVNFNVRYSNLNISTCRVINVVDDQTDHFHFFFNFLIS